MRPGEGPSEERRAGRLWGKVHWQAEITLVRKVRWEEGLEVMENPKYSVYARCQAGNRWFLFQR